MRTLLSASAVLILLTALAIVPLLAQEGPDENEPTNNSICDTLYEDQNLVRGEIGAEGDHDDWFSLSGTGINNTLTLTFDPKKVEIDWEIIDDGKDPDYWDDRDPVNLAYLTNFGSPETVTVQTFGHCLVHLWAYSGQGSYTISLGKSKCQGLDEVEPNDTKDQANPAGHDIIEGSVCAGDNDWYVIYGRENEYWSLTLNFDATETEVDWEIYSDDRKVATGTNYGSPDTISCDVPGKCYIHVWQFSGEGEYMISLAGYTNTDI